MHLAIDSVGRGCSAALAEESGASFRLVAERAFDEARGQADQIVALVDELLADAGVSYDSLDLIAVDVGPGSFTGVRTGIAAVRALALATGLPVLPLTAFEVLAAAAAPHDGADLLVALDARRGEVYVQRFDALGRPVAPPAVHRPEVVARDLPRCVRLVGSGAGAIRRALGEEVDVAGVDAPALDAAAVARCAARHLAAGAQPIAGIEIRPLYLRAPDARPQRPWPSAAPV